MTADTNSSLNESCRLCLYSEEKEKCTCKRRCGSYRCKAPRPKFKKPRSVKIRKAKDEYL